MAKISIIGAGHNGLVCACYLQKQGHEVSIYEQRDVVGGAAVTETFHPGFKNSVASYTVSLLQQQVIDDLNLNEHGLKIVPRHVQNILLHPEGNHLVAGPTLDDMKASIAQSSQKDADALDTYYADIEKVADIIRKQLLKSPVNLGNRWHTFTDALGLLKDVYATDKRTQELLIALMTQSAGDFLARYFESDAITALFGFDSIVGNYASPYTQGSAYVLLHHVIGEINGQKGMWGHAIGGMGAITQAMAKEAERLGVSIYLNQKVTSLRIDKDKIMGFSLDGGKNIDCDVVASNLNPKLLFTKLCPPDALPPSFLENMQHYRCGSGTFRMNVALKELPQFNITSEVDYEKLMQAGIIIAPSLEYMEQSYFDAKQFGFSKKPIIEMLIPSTLDDSLAPKGQHVASLFCQHFSPTLTESDWAQLKPQAIETIIDTVTEYAPNFKNSILGMMALSPVDLEKKFGLVGGDIFHGALNLDQLYSLRPSYGYAQYQSPIKGLFMCGAGTHPGGGVTGAPGFNAAKEMIKQLK